ncbi:MAG: DUF2949 domain-containing protein [Phormidesmis sp. CAN_BIN36]|nr:DUF2949 domain-containing protein [Phormidesmis sp. CAN_BIN36]
MELNRRLNLIRFLKEELALPAAAIELAARQSDQAATALPIVLWQYGLVTLAQLDQIFDQMEII